MGELRSLAAVPAATRPPLRGEYYRRIGAQHMAPLWEVLGALVPPAPDSPALPALWRYADVRDQVLEAGRLISAAEAERRVLILENPGLSGQSCITPSLYAGLQLILPGEVAPAHRHAQSALRVVLEGAGAYTTVDGERVAMQRGDFVVTPAWAWHDHGNTGSEPVVWLDGLDIPLLRFLGAGFAEKAREAVQVPARACGAACAFVHPLARTREALHDMARCDAPDAHLGYRLEHVDAASGRSPLPTLGAFTQALPAGFETQGRRGTDGTVYLCLEGDGDAEIEGNTLRWAENDVFVVPSWQTLRLRAGRDALLFGFSDRPVQQALGLWREERL